MGRKPPHLLRAAASAMAGRPGNSIAVAMIVMVAMFAMSMTVISVVAAVFVPMTMVAMFMVAAITVIAVLVFMVAMMITMFVFMAPVVIAMLVVAIAPIAVESLRGRRPEQVGFRKIALRPPLHLPDCGAVQYPPIGRPPDIDQRADIRRRRS
jgi:predicted membrane protein